MVAFFLAWVMSLALALSGSFVGVAGAVVAFLSPEECVEILRLPLCAEFGKVRLADGAAACGDNIAFDLMRSGGR